MLNGPKKPLFSPEARRAAIEARQRRFVARDPSGAPQIFVVRLAGPQWFGWEIRKFGGLVVNRSEACFETQMLAREAGERALAELTTA